MNVLEEFLDTKNIEITRFTIGLKCRNCRRTWGVKTYSLEALISTPDWFICDRCREGEMRYDRQKEQSQGT